MRCIEIGAVLCYKLVVHYVCMCKLKQCDEIVAQFKFSLSGSNLMNSF